MEKTIHEMSLLPTQRTSFTPNEKIQKKWILLDAEDQILGRMASRIAHRLRGKHRADYSPHQDCGDGVVVINAEKVRITGRKLENKVYYKHSGYVGGLKTATLKEKMRKDPAFAVKKAVQRMLPKGPLGRKLLGHLKVYPGSGHPHKGQTPELLDPAKL